jgi:acetylornithine deacetylase/succinyl-diaminopimelate desuccinylase-like protein
MTVHTWRALAVAALFLVARGAVPATQTGTPDWKAQATEILQHYRALIATDTSSPPGNETRAVTYLKGVFDREGIPASVFALDPARANLVARLKGSGRKRPLLLMAHTDVVGVQREKWPVDPFGAVLKDGYVWGRGSVDDKDKLVANLMVMVLLKRSATPLDRDVIFLAESGEEGNTSVGIDFMVAQHFDQIDAEYALSEGGSAEIEDGRVRLVRVTTTEKVPRRVRLVVNGTSGHGSVPRTDNAVVHLASAVSKLGAWETPMRFNETTLAYFQKLATTASPESAARYRALVDPQRAASALRYLAENEPRHNSMLRTSVTPTIVSGGFRMNVIPSEAEATLDVRALPDEDMPAFYETMKRVIADPAVRVETLAESVRPVGQPSRLDTEMYRALERAAQRVYPGATTVPAMLTGATDMAQLRAKGIQSYGIGPASTQNDSDNFGAHSDVERLAESSLYRFVEFTWLAVTEVAASKN